MTYTTSRSNQPREAHLIRGGAFAAAAMILAAPGLLFMRDLVLATEFIRTDAAANVIWTLWCLPIIALGAAAARAFVSARRVAPAYRGGTGSGGRAARVVEAVRRGRFGPVRNSMA